MKRYGTTRLWLVVAAFALRAFVPAGYMPAALADALPFVPCPGAAPGWSSLVEGSDHHAAADHDHGGEDSLAWDFCPFAVVTGGTAPAVSCELSVPSPWRGPPLLAAATAPVHRLLAANPCLPRAPPAEPPLHI